MSIIKVLTCKDEAGTFYNPAENTYQQTTCTDVAKKNKKYEVVFLHDDGEGGWIVDPVWVPNQSIVALKVTNPCDSSIAYLAMNQNDYRLAQQCCSPVTIGAEMTTPPSIEEGLGIFLIMQLGCEGDLVLDISEAIGINYGADLAATLILVAAYLNLTYPEVGVFTTDGLIIILSSANPDVFACLNPIFTITLTD